MTESPSNEMQSYRTSQGLPATILLVEDEPAVRNVTREALEMGAIASLRAMDRSRRHTSRVMNRGRLTCC